MPGGGWIRRGGSTPSWRGNTIAQVAGGVSYTALAQCVGEAVVIDRTENF